MKKRRPSVPGFLVLMLLAYLFLPLLMRLPITPEQHMRQEVPDWTGVVEIWLCETFQPGKGSFSGWLEKQARVFEKQNSGVLVKITSIKPELALERIAAGDNLPDAILCGGGLFETADVLLKMPESAARQVFLDAVSVGGDPYGMPVAAGAYTILYNSQRYAQAASAEDPESFLRALVTSTTKNRKTTTSFAISCAQSKYISPVAGMLSMLEVPFEAADALSPETCRLEPSVAWAGFVLDRKSAAYACTQKEVYRIRQLEAGGSAFAWQVHETPATYTDQLLALYCFDTGKQDAKERAETAGRYGRLLQSLAAQQALADVGAFSVIELPETLYPAGSFMGAMESGISGDELLVPNQIEWMTTRLNLASGEKNAADAADALAPARALLQSLRGKVTAQPPFL